MAFDKSTRNRLQKFVSESRSILIEEFTRQLQAIFGLDPKNGTIAEVDSLSYLDNIQRQTAVILRDTIAHYGLSISAKSDKERIKQALDRIIREQAFTVLNRLAALRMAEARGFLLESIAKGYSSKGFQLYKYVAGTALGERGDAYRCYIFSLFDEFSLDLAVLFDRHSAQSRLFPREAALLALLEQVNHFEIEPLWVEDETIGWIYQYYNDSEERKKMRKESAAPRNSRELAVRNQFFTPRYVVEFLTDNTLGRIWYEMTRGQTRLVEQCRYIVRQPTEIFLDEGETAPETHDQEGLNQEELLKQPVHVPHRVIKDPREIRLLDPACGSMHFGLYAFDLFEMIYEESWDKGTCPALREAYASKEKLLREVPRLIIEHNIHGIDIDPRAVQIAGLSLWLRAQKSWQTQSVKPVDRPIVRRSNIVCAEPMPGSPEILEEFVSTLDPPLLGDLVKTVFAKMQLASEAGSLLKIEEEIRTAIDIAHKAWEKLESKPRELFSTEELSQGFAPVKVFTTDFWDTAEQQVIDSLREYSEQADADSYKHRLFADDAARSFGFIDVCRKRYDAIVMNPPFGNPVESTSGQLALIYPDAKHDVALAMVEVSQARVTRKGCIGALTTRTPLFNSSSANWRETSIFERGSLSLCMDLGGGVLEAMVEVAAYVLNQSSNGGNSIFFQLTTEPVETKDISSAFEIHNVALGKSSMKTFVRKLTDLHDLPNASLAYWLPSSLVRCFGKNPPLRENGAEAWVGLQTSKDDRFLRAWWEVPSNRQGWIPFAKGGEASPYLADVHLVINWMESGYEMKAYHDWLNQIGKSTPGNGPRREFPFYFIHGLTWVYRTDRFHVQPLPAGCITSTRGPGIYSDTQLEFLLGFLNSIVADLLVKVMLGKHKQPQFDIDDVNAIPTPRTPDPILGELGKAAWAVKLRAAMLKEKFLLGCIGLQFAGFRLNGFADMHHKATNDYTDALAELQYFQSEVDSCANTLLGVSDVEIKSMSSLLFNWTDFGLSHPDKRTLVERCMSFSLGTAFGRWDIRYATGERQPPELPDLFDPLPVCPPGMLQNAVGLSVEPQDVPADYPLRISWPGILVDDENHPEDVLARVREAIKVIWRDRAEAIEQEACEILGVKTLRDYFRRPASFFADHLKRYSKSRRQAPIYWSLSTKSGSYTLWLYYQRLTDQTLYACVLDLVEPKLKTVTDDLNGLRNKSARSSGEEKELAHLTDLEAELKDFLDELQRVAKFWKPNLNDGVQITAAPLWTLFQHKPWQKKLKATWEQLEKGDYDWAHLAYSIWPERVLRKCHKDRSLAIAHEVETDFWVEVEVSQKAKGKKSNASKTQWQPKKLNENELRELIRQKITTLKTSP
jgi:hypothetical protein